jgi:hypothetical protein
MAIWLAGLLPVRALEVLPAFTLIGLGLLVEKYYVSRITLISNAVALTTYFYRFENLNPWLVLYINILTIVGIVSLVSYLFEWKLSKDFYFVTGIFSSVVSGAILLYGLSL